MREGKVMLIKYLERSYVFWMQFTWIMVTQIKCDFQQITG